MDAKETGRPGHSPSSGDPLPAGPEEPVHPQPQWFGIDPRARPGDVPWGAWRALAGLLLAFVAVLALTSFLAATSPATSSQATGGTLSGALAVFASTVLVDSWFVIVAWGVSLRHFRLSLASWGLRRPHLTALKPVPAVLGLVYLFSLAYNVVAHPPEQRVLTDFPHTGPGIASFAIMAIVVAPFFEELFFRGFLFQGLARSFGAPAGAIISAAIFALAHQQLSVFVPLFVLGLALAYLFHRTGSIWTNMALHASFNAIGVLLWAALIA